jgi:valyl-tRNA synthetase
MAEIPQKYDSQLAEKKWAAQWEASGIYRWDPDRPRQETFAVDTPPLTTSGSLHVGHVFGYVQTDVLVRYQRMRGRNIAYPMGWDDNGLPTERRTQNLFRIRPSPDLTYDPAFRPDRDKRSRDPVEPVSRLNFIEACGQVTEEDEKVFEDVWQTVGLSVDWSLTYATIDPHCRRISQLSFLDLVRKGHAYQAVAPTTWDIDDRTAVAQAETEDREQSGAFHDIRFAIEGGGDFTIATTRPELLGACIAVVAHPDDARYRELFGKRAITPLFRAAVPILPAEHADPEKGTGILMVCTFGDVADVEFWRSSGLPLRQLIGLDGRMRPLTFGEAPFESLDPGGANASYAEIQGLNAKRARKRMAELLAEDGSLVGEPRPVQHSVRFYERGSQPLELVPTRQWFVHLLEHKQALIEQGRQVEWDPPYMRTRYEHWVEGLNQDWNLSRQRYFGVPIPVWYEVRDDGEIDYDRPILPTDDMLPLDPTASPPPGYDQGQRNQPGGFAGDGDVFDTWATSSVTPQIMSHWTVDPERHTQLFPMDLRPQGHDIIRTWAFYTIVKAWMHEGVIPWRRIMLNGWILDPDRKKMSKSKGNVVTPASLLSEYSADAVRYWAGRARPGVDTIADPKTFKVGRRLAMKVFNASRFVLTQLDSAGARYDRMLWGEIREPLDLALMARMRGLVEQSAIHFEAFDYPWVLHSVEETFWDFCDNYLELVKLRSYADEDSAARRSGLATLETSLHLFLRLLAPFLPYVTEEVWSWRFAGSGRDASVHTAAWPQTEELDEIPAPDGEGHLECAIEVLGKIRRTKTDARKPLRWPIDRLAIRGSQADCRALEAVLADVLAAGAVGTGDCTIEPGEAPEEERFSVEAELGPDPD